MCPPPGRCVESDECFNEKKCLNAKSHQIHIVVHIHSGDPLLVTAAYVSCSRAPQWTFVVGGNGISQPRARLGIQSDIPAVIKPPL